MTIRKEVIHLAGGYWGKIARAGAKALGRRVQGFLPHDPSDRNGILGWGVYGVVWETADPRFVVKITADPTEGPSISEIIHDKKLHKNEGVVYFHKVWQVPGVTMDVPQHGKCLVWVVLREELTCADRACRKAVCKKLDDLGCAARDLSVDRGAIMFGYNDLPGYVDSEIEFVESVYRLKGTQGEPIAKFMATSYERKGLVFSDMHSGNVGRRCHNLSSFGVPRKKTLVIRDVGDPFGTYVRSVGDYPSIPLLR